MNDTVQLMNDRFSNVHQGKPLSKCDRNLVGSLRKSHRYGMFPYYLKTHAASWWILLSFCHVSIQVSLDTHWMIVHW